MQQESSQSDLAERDAPTRSRARRFPGGAAEGAGAERVCLSVRPSVCLSACRRSLSRLSGTRTARENLLFSPRRGLLERLWIHRSCFHRRGTVGCSSAHRGGGGRRRRRRRGASLSFFDYQADSPLERLNTEEEEEEV